MFPATQSYSSRSCAHTLWWRWSAEVGRTALETGFPWPSCNSNFVQEPNTLGSAFIPDIAELEPASDLQEAWVGQGRSRVVRPICKPLHIPACPEASVFHLHTREAQRGRGCWLSSTAR